jgi:D-amino-acid dehydrogenase
LPVIGPSTERSGLWYATGHARGGILLTPWTAHTIVEALTGSDDPTRDTPWSAARYRR